MTMTTFKVGHFGASASRFATLSTLVMMIGNSEWLMMNSEVSGPRVS